MICFDQFACFLLIEVKKHQCICMLRVDQFAWTEDDARVSSRSWFNPPQHLCGSPPGNLERFPVENHTSSSAANRTTSGITCQHARGLGLE